MRTGFGITTIMGAIMLTCPLAGMAAGQRIGAGLEYDIALGDIDNGIGGYVSYEIDLPAPMTLMFEVVYAGGDFDVAAGSGSYGIVGVGGALLFMHDFDAWTGYLGAGCHNSFNDFASINYDDKLSMLWIAGARFAIADRLSADVGLRYRTLRIDSIDKTIEPNPLDADAILLRVGLVYEL